MDDVMTGGTGQGIVKPERRGPAEGQASMGIDREQERRPGAPMRRDPAEDVEVVKGRPVEQQEEQLGERLHRHALDRPTAVFGTAQPRHGLSGTLRKAAYGVPEHRKRHWAMLMMADRVDVLEGRVGHALARPLEAAGANGAAERVRSMPLVALGVVAGTALLVSRLAR